LSQVDPALQFGNGTTANAFSLAGVSSRDSSEIGDPAVPVGIDGSSWIVFTTSAVDL